MLTATAVDSIEVMSSLPPTSRAVGAAVAHHRQRQGFTVDNIVYSLAVAGHPLSAANILDIESSEHAPTVDDLVALAAVLGVTPVELLSHVPEGMPDADEEQLATGVPDGVDQPQLRAWMEGRSDLAVTSRASYWLHEDQRLDIIRTHHEDQLEAARVELDDLGEFALREADAGPVIALHERIAAGGADTRAHPPQVCAG